ncbi:MAG: hypothetical protein JNM50_11970 [Chromatiales bacterium]|jgi:hypothetical protein|nr:hypothetical protein [Chromatiales bacterium]
MTIEELLDARLGHYESAEAAIRQLDAALTALRANRVELNPLAAEALKSRTGPGGQRHIELKTHEDRVRTLLEARMATAAGLDWLTPSGVHRLDDLAAAGRSHTDQLRRMLLGVAA